MLREDAFVVEGEVLGRVSERSAWVALGNGHRLVAYMKGTRSRSLRALTPGQKVMVRLSPYDMSKGVVVEEKTDLK